MKVSALSKEELLRRACERVAHVMRGTLQDYGSADTRLLGEPLVPDDLVIVGRSSSSATYREHVIPRLELVKAACKQLQSGATDSAVGAFIAQHLKIVLLSKEESERLNAARHANLRQRMPDGWDFGDDPFERLRVAGISVTVDSAPRD